GGFVIEVARDDKLQDLHECDLDGLGVLEDGQVDGAGSCAARRINEETVRYADIVKIAEAAGAEGGRAALGAVGLNVLTTLNFHDECSTPSPLVIFKNHQVRVGSLYKGNYPLTVGIQSPQPHDQTVIVRNGRFSIQKAGEPS